MPTTSRLTLIHNSVAGLIHPGKDGRTEATCYLAFHCAALTLFALMIFDKHVYDLATALRGAWPIETHNPRNILSAGGLCGFALFLFYTVIWSRVGRRGRHEQFWLKHYALIAWLSLSFTLVLSLMLATWLNLPELSLALAVVNLILVARWSTKQWQRLVADMSLPSHQRQC